MSDSYSYCSFKLSHDLQSPTHDRQVSQLHTSQTAVTSIDIIKSRRCIDRCCRRAVGLPSWTSRQLHSVSSVRLVQWTVSALHSSYLTEYKADFHTGFFAEKVIHVAMIQETCLFFLSKVIPRALLVMVRWFRLHSALVSCLLLLWNKRMTGPRWRLHFLRSASFAVLLRPVQNKY